MFSNLFFSDSQTMKNRISCKSLLLFPFLLAVISCGYNKFEQVKQQPPVDLPAATHTIADLKAMYKPGSKGTTISGEVIIRGVVSTSDRQGSLYRTMDLQDATGGIEVKMGMANLSLLYPQGYEVAIKCRNLVLGQYGDVINLGFTSIDEKYETGFIPDLMVPKVMLCGRYVGITPQLITIETAHRNLANTLVQLNEVQFIESELGQTYADPINKNSISAVNRTLIDKQGHTIVVRTSSYALFAGKKIPQGSGSVVALLTYFRDTPQLVILDDRTDIKLTNPRF